MTRKLPEAIQPAPKRSFGERTAPYRQRQSKAQRHVANLLHALQTIQALAHEPHRGAHNRIARIQLALDRLDVCGLCGASSPCGPCAECGITVCRECGEQPYPDVTCCDIAKERHLDLGERKP